MKQTTMMVEIRHVKKVSFLAIVFVAFLTIVSFLAPIIFMSIFSSDLNPAFLFTVVIFWGTGYYFLRLLLWNLYGKEIFEISADKINIYHDFKYFRLFHGSISTHLLNIGFIPFNTDINNWNEPKIYLKLVLESKNKTLSSEVPLEREKAIEIQKRIREGVSNLTSKPL